MLDAHFNTVVKATPRINTAQQLPWVDATPLDGIFCGLLGGGASVHLQLIEVDYESAREYLCANVSVDTVLRAQEWAYPLAIMWTHCQRPGARVQMILNTYSVKSLDPHNSRKNVLPLLGIVLAHNSRYACPSLQVMVDALLDPTMKANAELAKKQHEAEVARVQGINDQARGAPGGSASSTAPAGPAV